MNGFTIIKKDKKTKARLGVLKTPHGTIKTPSYVFVGTYGHFRNLNPRDIKKTNTQLIIANTFHLWQKVLKAKKLKTKTYGTFIHDSFEMKVPIMTDSGGFQVLSLAFADKTKVSKFMTGSPETDVIQKRSKIKITSKGVYFFHEGKKKFLGPEISMKLQSKIGADIIFAFDHITSPLDTLKYNKKALKLTDKWAKICLTEHAKNQIGKKNRQMLFGIVQGGVFPKLRKQSAKSIGSMPFDGFGIGGSYTKEQISKTLKWMIPYLPEEKPRHLLGVGKVADIFEAIENGIDTFDCVIPTREARHGRLYTRKGYIDIRRGYFLKDKKVTEKGCICPTCKAKITRSTIHQLIKNKDWKINGRGQRYCLMHNMWFFNKLLKDIRKSIEKGKFSEFKKKTLTKYQN